MPVSLKVRQVDFVLMLGSFKKFIWKYLTLCIDKNFMERTILRHILKIDQNEAVFLDENFKLADIL